MNRTQAARLRDSSSPRSGTFDRLPGNRSIYFDIFVANLLWPSEGPLDDFTAYLAGLLVQGACPWTIGRNGLSG